jgi:hypothetical protein
LYQLLTSNQLLIKSRAIWVQVGAAKQGRHLDGAEESFKKSGKLV